MSALLRHELRSVLTAVDEYVDIVTIPNDPLDQPTKLIAHCQICRIDRSFTTELLYLLLGARVLVVPLDEHDICTRFGESESE